MSRRCKIILWIGVALVVLSHFYTRPWLGMLGALAILIILFIDCERQKSCRR